MDPPFVFTISMVNPVPAPPVVATLAMHSLYPLPPLRFLTETTPPLELTVSTSTEALLPAPVPMVSVGIVVLGILITPPIPG